jgi:3-hydroxyisobutyrate dehydrogenase-like beta-hydroxyacid dehydrogenase
MAKNLIAKGYHLTVMAHRNRAPIEDLVGRGATEAKTPREMAGMVDIVILCVTGAPQVLSVIEGENGLTAADRPLLVIDCSTSDPSATTALAERLAERNIDLVDAPLGGTPEHAEDGTLSVMAGGTDEAYARAEPIFMAIAEKAVHTGPCGSGHTMKLLNNFLSLGYAALYSEALMLAAKSGISDRTFDSVIRGGRMDCGFYRTFASGFLDRNPDAHKFTLRNAFKDVTYLANLANAISASNPIGSAVRNSYGLAVGLGHGSDYVPLLVEIVRNANAR